MRDTLDINESSEKIDIKVDCIVRADTGLQRNRWVSFETSQRFKSLNCFTKVTEEGDSLGGFTLPSHAYLLSENDASDFVHNKVFSHSHWLDDWLKWTWRARKHIWNFIISPNQTYSGTRDSGANMTHSALKNVFIKHLQQAGATVCDLCECASRGSRPERTGALLQLKTIWAQGNLLCRYLIEFCLRMYYEMFLDVGGFYHCCVINGWYPLSLLLCRTIWMAGKSYNCAAGVGNLAHLTGRCCLPRRWHWRTRGRRRAGWPAGTTYCSVG